MGTVQKVYFLEPLCQGRHVYRILSKCNNISFMYAQRAAYCPCFITYIEGLGKKPLYARCSGM